MAVSLGKKAKLERRAGLPDTTCLVEPGFTVVGHELYFYIAYLESEKGEAEPVIQPREMWTLQLGSRRVLRFEGFHATVATFGALEKYEAHAEYQRRDTLYQ
jgi:hypothetical protein